MPVIPEAAASDALDMVTLEAASAPYNDTVHVLLPCAKLIMWPITYSPAASENELNVIGWISGTLHPPWNIVKDTAPAVVLVPVDHTLEPEIDVTEASDVLLPKE